MISTLAITNYALIRQLNIQPNHGLNIVTGETGAGKSIMLGALGLLLGRRADAKSLLDEEKKCVVEAVFDIERLKLNEIFESLDLDYENETIIRREISPNGKSRAFINDVPVTLDVLKKIGPTLVDIHSQNDSLQLSNKQVKLNVIDDYAQSADLLLQFQNSFQQFSSTFNKLQDLQEKDKSAKEDADYKNFLLEELLNANLEGDNQESLEEELNMLENAEEIKLKLSQIVNEFDEGDLAIIDRMKSAVSVVNGLSSFSSDLGNSAERFSSAVMELQDVVQELRRSEEIITHDHERIVTLNERIDLINRLQQKHKVADLAALLEIKTKLEEEVLSTQNLNDQITELEQLKASQEKEMLLLAEQLSDQRRANIDDFSNAMNQLLATVGMPEGHLEVAYKRVPPSKTGIDEIELLFSANKGIAPEPVGKVASGGEYSRLMFCVKYLLAQKTAMPTVIFDEIDTGVSGEIAIKMAAMMKKMSTHHQIISISHLPQVAARGETHYYVYKDTSADKTESLIKQLKPDERLAEIAKMIGGDNPSETAISSARELIGRG